MDALAFALKDEETAVRKAVVIALDTIRGSQASRPLLLAITTMTRKYGCWRPRPWESPALQRLPTR